MDSQHKAIRAKLSGMAPKRAISYVKSFELPADEQNSLIECDVHNLSCIQAAQALNMSPEQLKRARQRAFRKIADQLDNGISKKPRTVNLGFSIKMIPVLRLKSETGRGTLTPKTRRPKSAQNGDWSH